MTLKEFFEKTKHLDPETEICIVNWDQTGRRLYLEDFTEEIGYEVFCPYENDVVVYTDSGVDLLDRTASEPVNLVTLTFNNV